MASLDARRAFLAGLIDYAGLFPPASLSMEEAVEEYRRARGSGRGWLLARFICPASRLDELAGHLVEDEPHWALSVLMDLEPAETMGAAESFGEKTSGRVELVEGRVAPRHLAEAIEASGLKVRGFAEVDVAVLPEALGGVAEAGLGAKLRCGGDEVSDFPTPQEVALFVSSSRRVGIPFKLTAGLHHPFRHFDPAEGFMRHGFVNLVAAAVLSLSHDLPPEDLAEVTADRDPEAFSLTAGGFRWRELRADAETVGRARRELFASFGSCSFDEPAGDLAALGLLS